MKQKKKKQSNNLTIKEILDKHNFSRKFVTTYAIACARDALTFCRDAKVKSTCTETLNITERYINGNATETELKAAIKAADASASTASAYASASASAYYASASTAYASASYAYASASASNAAGKSRPKDYCRDLLLTMIESLSKLEKVMLGIGDCR